MLNYCVAPDGDWVGLISALLRYAKEDGLDLCMTMDNFDHADGFLSALQFDSFARSGGSDALYFHVYNWRCPPMQPSDVGIQFW